MLLVPGQGPDFHPVLFVSGQVAVPIDAAFLNGGNHDRVELDEAMVSNIPPSRGLRISLAVWVAGL